MPLRAKSRLVVFGNHEDRDWSKSDQFAPVLCSDSLHFLTSLAVERRHILKQGDVKNTFCNGVLPPEEVTIIHPPQGDPTAKPDEYWLLCKTLYGLCCSPGHWYDKINTILLSMGLVPNSHDPCLYSGFIVDPTNKSDNPTNLPRSLLAFTWMILSIFPKATLLRRNLNLFYPNSSMLISWVTSNGSWEFISCGASPRPPYLFTLIKLHLQLILLNVLTSKTPISLLPSLHINLVFQLMLSTTALQMFIPLHKYVVRRPIKVLLCTHFCPRTTRNHLLGI